MGVFKYIFNTLEKLAAINEFKKMWLFIGSNDVEKQNLKEIKRKHKTRIAGFAGEE